MRTLVALLRQLESDPTIKSSKYLTDGEEGTRHPLIEDIDTAACNALITDKGSVSYYAIEQLKAYGYKVTKGESDSFGWLSGCIHTNKGIIVFG